MFEKVNPSHPDKVADRIAGAVVDLCYQKNSNPKAAVEVLIGHGVCHMVYVSTVLFSNDAKVIHDRVDIQEIAPMTDWDYQVSGFTALMDALGGAIHHIANIHKYARPRGRARAYNLHHNHRWHGKRQSCIFRQKGPSDDKAGRR